MKSSFIWEDFDNSKLKKLRKIYNLENLVSNGKSEFEKQLLLRDWVFKKLPLGIPSRDYSELSSFEILDDIKKGYKFYCTQYTQLFLQSATSLGWFARKLSVDTDHGHQEKDMHHGICDIWSNEYKKWYVVDPMHNLHYEKDGIPLNALEIRNEYLKNKATDITGFIGVRDRNIKYNEDSRGFNTPSNYFWFFISLRNNFFEKPGLFNTTAYLWVDNYNRDKVWYKDKKPHSMYQNQFLKTDEISLAFPNLNEKS